MFKSNKDTTQIFGSLGPDNANYQAEVNTSVREAENRWPLLKITPPKKFDLTPNLSEEEKGRWLSSPKVKTENLKHVLSVQSSTSRDKMAESLKKMAGAKTKSKPKPDPSRIKPMDVNTEVEVKEVVQTQSSTEVKKLTELKKIAKLVSASVKAEADESKSLRGIFDRLTGRKPVVLPPPAAPVKSSVLRKLSMR